MIKTDCFAFREDNKGGRCDALKHLYCEFHDKCSFYGTVSGKKESTERSIWNENTR